jgi:ferric-dicitrate binding protein FerR (iron transport regulator)
MAGAAQLREVSGDGFAPAHSLEAESSVAPDSIITTSATERAALRIGKGHSLRLDIGSQVRVIDAGTIYLDSGAIYLASADPRRLGDRITVLTAFGEIREIGTQFEVRVSNESVRVRVREGEVVLTQGSITHDIGVGTEILMDADGSVATRRISTYGPEWAWVSGVTPMMDLEGRTAHEFLEWSAREQGWDLVFDSAELASSAGSITVAGDISGMTVDQALDAVLPSCRMMHRTVDGTLRVGRLP